MGFNHHVSYSVHKYNKLVRIHKITPSKSPHINKRNGLLNVSNRRSPNVNINRSSSSVVRSSSNSLHAVPCLASPSLQLVT